MGDPKKRRGSFSSSDWPLDQASNMIEDIGMGMHGGSQFVKKVYLLKFCMTLVGILEKWIRINGLLESLQCKRDMDINNLCIFHRHNFALCIVCSLSMYNLLYTDTNCARADV